MLLRPVSSVTACLTILTAPGASQAPGGSPRDVVARAVEAMGGADALRDIRNVTTEFHVATYALGQEETPESPARATMAYGRVHMDYAGARKAGNVEQRTLTGAVNQLRRMTVGGIGMLETNGRPTPDNPGVVAGEEASLRRAAERILLAALDNAAALTALPPRTLRGEPHDGVRYASGADTVDLYFDRRSGLLTVTESLTDDPILGDRQTQSWFTRWQEAGGGGGGAKFARQYDVFVNGRLQSHSVFTAVTVNTDMADSMFAIPDSIAARAQRGSTTPPPVVVTLAELAPGVWRAEGGSHHSLVVEQGAGLVVVEAPQHSRRSQAVLDTLRSRFPAKPVSLVVNTHHHWDHAGGLRAYLAAGVPVATHVRNAAFVRQIGAARKTIAPDALSRRPRAAVVRAVEDSLVVGTGESRVVVYHLPTAHAEGMLGAYVPNARLFFTSDVLSPGATLAPAGSREVAAFVRSRGLTVDRVAGGHGGVANWQDVIAAGSN